MFREAPLPFAGQRPSDRFLPLQRKLGQPCIQICFGRFEAQLLMDAQIRGEFFQLCPIGQATAAGGYLSCASWRRILLTNPAIRAVINTQITVDPPRGHHNEKSPPILAVILLCRCRIYSNFLSYSRAAIRTTKQEPALCTSAPVVGFKTPLTDSATARRLMHMDRPILNLMVLTVALDSRFR